MVEEWQAQQTPGGLICTAGSCSACSNPNPLTDTVRIPPMVRAPSLMSQDEEGKQRMEEIAAQWRAGSRAEDVQREAETEAQWRAGDEARQAQEEEAALRKKAEEAEARHAETRRVAEQARIQREERERQAELEEQAKRAELAQRRRSRIDIFLKEHGYTNGINGFKKTCMKKKYPIHSAAKRGDVEILEILILEGANVSEKDSKGKTALDIAQQKKLTGAVQVLSGTAS
mmetsp:Transcript_116576/g.341179  ORF Transcript_116576/g.341179 Transcript_116576/m.341179 type:complete len:230 (+) Transcript_116576:1-690(+)